MIEIKRKRQQAVTEAHRGAETPLTAHDAQRAGEPTAQPTPTLKRPLKPFTALDSSRNYRAMYRAACDFHERHNPPTLDSSGGADYWTAVTEDMTETAGRFDGDLFITGLLIAIFEELEREYRQLQGEAEP